MSDKFQKDSPDMFGEEEDTTTEEERLLQQAETLATLEKETMAEMVSPSSQAREKKMVIVTIFRLC